MAIDTTIQIISLQEARDFLEIASGETSILEALVDAANQAVHTYTGRMFAQTTYTDQYDGTDSPKLLLKNHPVISVTSLYIDSNRAFASSSLIATTDYIVDKKAGMLILWNRESHFPLGFRNVQVVYVAGYATMPADLRHAAKLILMQQYKRQYQDKRVGLLSETVGERTFTFANEAIPKQAQLILDRYRQMGVQTNGHTV